MNNGQCSHLCLIAPLPRGHTCACPTGVLLQEDKKTCNEGMLSCNCVFHIQESDACKTSK